MWFHIVGLLVMLALGILAAPLTLEAQQPAKVYRVGFLSLLPQEQALSHIKALHEGLRGLGYIEGQNIILEYRFADGTAERLPGLVAELIHLKVDIIVTGFGTLSALAAKQATSTTLLFSVLLPIQWDRGSLQVSPAPEEISQDSV